MKRKRAETNNLERRRPWLTSAKAVFVLVGGLLAFLVASALPLYRNELLPALSPASLVAVELKYNADEGRNLWRNRRDRRIFAESDAGFLIRVSNNSDYQLVVEDVRIKTSRTRYSTSKDIWEGGWVYLSGVDTMYDSLKVEVCEGQANAIKSAFSSAVIGDDDDSMYRKIIHAVPPHETDYIFLEIRCGYNKTAYDRRNSPLRQAALLRFQTVLVLKGREFSLEFNSPVHLLEGSEDDNNPMGHQIEMELDQGSRYSHHDNDP